MGDADEGEAFGGQALPNFGQGVNGLVEPGKSSNDDPTGIDVRVSGCKPVRRSTRIQNELTDFVFVVVSYVVPGAEDHD